MNKTSRYVYGPVPSRRLGRSLGVDLVPFKTCTYDCIYCQLGRTTNRTVERREYVPISAVTENLKRKISEDVAPDFITLAGSGEPTLNSGLGELIHRIKEFTSTPIAVITNGSLLWMHEVQEALSEADLVMPSLDAGDESVYRHVNRPHPDIKFDQMVNGLIEFTAHFSGAVWLELFLLAGVTGMTSEVRKMAALVERIGPDRIDLNTVSRPPAEEFACPVPLRQLEKYAVLFGDKAHIIKEGSKACDTASSLVVKDDILGLLRRRPCTLTDIAMGLGLHVAAVAKCIDSLMATREVSTLYQNGQWFYVAESPRKGKGAHACN